jgi:PKD repeat protein
MKCMSKLKTVILCVIFTFIILLSRVWAASELKAVIKVTPIQGTWGYPVIFDALDSTIPQGAQIDYSWNFGDGTTGSGPETSHAYEGRGKITFDVILTLTNSDTGEESTAHQSIFVTKKISGKVMMEVVSPSRGERVSVSDLVPVEIDFDRATNGLSVDPLTFEARVNKYNVTNLFELITDPLRDGEITGAQAEIPLTYINTRKKGKNVLLLQIASEPYETRKGKLKVIRDKEKVAFKVDVNLNPVAQFTYAPGNPLVGQAVTFNASASTDPEGESLTYTWDFDSDGTPEKADLTDPITTYTFPSSGEYLITLTVFDGTWHVSATELIEVRNISNRQPKAAFTYSPVNPVEGQEITFDASDSSDPDNQPLMYKWDLGDGTISEYSLSPVINHTFQAGAYTVTLTVSDGDLEDSISEELIVEPADLPVMAVTESLDFGLVRSLFFLRTNPFYARNEVDMFVEIVNEGGGVLEITSASITGDDEFSLLPDFEIPPLASGQSYFLTVRFSPKPSITNPYNAFLNLESNGGNAQIPLTARVDYIPVGSLRMMRYNANDKNESGSVFNVGFANDRGRSHSLLTLYNQGATPVTITGWEIVGTDSSYFSADMSSSSITIPEKKRITETGEELVVTFTGSDRDDPVLRTALLILHNDGDSDAVVGLIGWEGNVADVMITAARKDMNFEFERVTAGSSTDRLGSNVRQNGEEEFITPAKIYFTNIGSKDAVLTAAITPVSDDGGIPQFAAEPESVTVGLDNPEVEMSIIFKPTERKHHSAIVTLTSSEPRIEPRVIFVHGYTLGSTEHVLGPEPFFTPIEEWYITADSYLAKMGRFGSGTKATMSIMGNYWNLPDPFLVGSYDGELTERLFPESYYIEQSNLAIAGGRLFLLDPEAYTVNGPYFLDDYLNTAATNARIQAGIDAGIPDGEVIGLAGIVRDNAFIDIGHRTKDIYSHFEDGVDMDVASDRMMFYTETVDESLLGNTSDVIRTGFYMQVGAPQVVTEDLMGLLGVAEPETLVEDIKAIKVGTEYWLIFLLDNFEVWSLKLSSSGNPLEYDNVTDMLSDYPEIDFRMDSQGYWYTIEAVVNENTSRHRVYRENMFNPQGIELFAESPEIPFVDHAEDLLIDKQGNVFVYTERGLYRFNPDSSPYGYVLSGHTFFTQNLIGNEPGYQNAEWDIDFLYLWLEK